MKGQGPEVPHIVFMLPAVLMCLPIQHAALFSNLKLREGFI